MSDTLYSIITFAAIPLGGTQTVAHGLICNGTRLKPDTVFLQFQDAFEFVSADVTNLTIRNTSSASGNCTALCHVIHPIERSFGLTVDDGTFGEHLTPQPFVPGSPNASGGGGGPFQTLVFRPGGVAGENVFTDWTLLMTALTQLQGTRVIQFDDSLVSPIVIPVGGPYNMTNVTWEAVPDFIVSVQIPEGASFTRLRTFQGRLAVRFTGATPPIADFGQAPPQLDSVTIKDGAQMSASGAGALFSVGANATFFIGDQAGLFLVAHSVINVTAAVTVTIFVQGEESVVATSTLTGIVGSTMNLIAAASAPFVFSQAQVGFLGALVVSNATRTRNFPSPVFAASTVLTTVAPTQLVQIDATIALPFILTLPLAADCLGQTIRIKNITAGANPVTVTAAGADTIDGAPTLVLAVGFFFTALTSDGVNAWYVTG